MLNKKMTFDEILQEIRAMILLEQRDEFVIAMVSFNELASKVGMEADAYLKALSVMYPDLAKACVFFFDYNKQANIRYVHKDSSVYKNFNNVMLALNEYYLISKLGVDLSLYDLQQCLPLANNNVFKEYVLAHYRNKGLMEILNKRYQSYMTLKDNIPQEIPTINILIEFCNTGLKLI